MPTLKIDDCRQCPNSTEQRIYTADSWENVQGVYCTKSGHKECGSYEWNDKHKIMPKWCPLEKRNKPKKEVLK